VLRRMTREDWRPALVAAGAASAITPRVDDKAGVFSADAVRKADQAIKEIKRRFNKDLVIETYESPPRGVDRTTPRGTTADAIAGSRAPC